MFVAPKWVGNLVVGNWVVVVGNWAAVVGRGVAGEGFVVVAFSSLQPSVAPAV